LKEIFRGKGFNESSYIKVDTLWFFDSKSKNENNILYNIWISGVDTDSQKRLL